jgi:endonuclease YncB( thermonuclease family)
MFQPVRESMPQLAARHAAALAFAGLLALPLVLTAGLDPVAARIGAVPHASITGEARVVDGDTLTIGAVRVRLEGVDAPELDQTCSRGAIRGWILGSWKCGKEAADHVARLVRDRAVRCDSRGTDAYGRMLGVCTVEGLEINADLVRQGLAWAFVKYSQRYVAVEGEARAAKRGIWQAETKPAWIWRAERWQAAEGERPPGTTEACLIKGNITRSGLIYHMPWDRWYDKTRIETAKGERWFCSIAEAEAAGWRPAVTR